MINMRQGVKMTKSQKTPERIGLGKLLWTILTFWIASVLTPSWILSYFVVQSIRRTWLFILSSGYRKSGLEFIKSSSIRSLMDRLRNQGIVTILVSVRGQCQPDLIKKHLHNLLERRDKCGNLMYPKLKQNLLSVWGCYAWQKKDNFNLDDNLLVGSTMFRGCVLSENNLQEYMSSIVTKYLPQDIPPWQIVLIPNVPGTEDTCDVYYYLLRIHHILLTEEKNLKICDLLMIKPTNVLYADLQQPLGEKNSIRKNPLLNVYETPTAIPNLYSKLTETCTNLWNEFLFSFDPLQNPELLKATPPLYTFWAVTIITVVTIIHEVTKGYYQVKGDLRSKMKFISSVTYREAERRHVSMKYLLQSVFVTFDPRLTVLVTLKSIIGFFIFFTIKIPLLFYREIRALYGCVFYNDCSNTGSIVEIFFSCIPLFYRAIHEFIYATRTIIETPKNILNETVFTKLYVKPPAIKHCGRKVVSWTQKIDAGLIKSLAEKANVTDTEIVLSAIGAATSKFFRDASFTVPDSIPITARHVNKNYIYSTSIESKIMRNDIGGLVCLNLPLIKEETHDDDIVAKWEENLVRLEQTLMKAREDQPFLYLMSRLQTKYEIITKSLPTLAIMVILNYLSTVYRVALTEMTSGLVEHKHRTTVWGQEIDNIIYWNPPQANLSLSLCISTYADTITLAIMTDALLSPHHISMGQEFTRFLEKIAEKYKV